LEHPEQYATAVTTAIQKHAWKLKNSSSNGSDANIRAAYESRNNKQQLLSQQKQRRLRKHEQ